MSALSRSHFLCSCSVRFLLEWAASNTTVCNTRRTCTAHMTQRRGESINSACPPRAGSTVSLERGG